MAAADDTAPAAGDASAFGHFLAQLAALAALRDSDPAALLAMTGTLPGRWAGRVDAAQAAVLDARRQVLVAGALVWLARFDEALVALDAADAALRGAGPGVAREAATCRMQALHARAFVSNRQQDHAGAFRAYQDALALALAEGDDAARCMILSNLANAYEEAGLFAPSIEHQRQSLALAEQLQLREREADARHNLGNALAASGDVQAGLESQRRAEALYVGLGLEGKVAAARVGIAERHHELRQHAQALDILAQLQGKAQTGTYPFLQAYASVLKAAVLLALGRSGEARTAFAQGHRQAQDIGDRAAQARACIGLAGLDLAEGRLDAAAGQAQAALEALQGTSAGREWVDAHALASRVHEARHDLARALAHARAHHDAYVRLFNEQASRKASLLAVAHQVETARGEAERQRLENARLSEALAEVADRLRQWQGGNQPAPAPRPTGPQALLGLGLTPREAEVLYWVTEGKTNEDVAAILGTGLPAVKKHLGHIYDKLGVENRTAAAAEVQRRVGRRGVPGPGR